MLIIRQTSTRHPHRLQRAEQEHHVRILFAIESAAALQGFASPNSDYDVLCLRPRDWYLAVDLERRAAM